MSTLPACANYYCLSFLNFKKNSISHIVSSNVAVEIDKPREFRNEC